MIRSLWTALRILILLGFVRLAFMLPILRELRLAPNDTLVKLWLTGLRFDVLVLGFVWIPLFLFDVFTAIFARVRVQRIRVFAFARAIYLQLFWLTASTLLFFDFFHFAKIGVHARFPDYERAFKLFPSLFRFLQMQQGSLNIFLVSFFFLLIWGSGFLILVGEYRRLRALSEELLDLTWTASTIRPPPSSIPSIPFFAQLPIVRRLLERPFYLWREVLFFGVYFLIIVFCARGLTLNLHHLGQEHSQVTKVRVLNEFALNGLWTLDKRQ